MLLRQLILFVNLCMKFRNAFSTQDNRPHRSYNCGVSIIYLPCLRCSRFLSHRILGGVILFQFTASPFTHYTLLRFVSVIFHLQGTTRFVYPLRILFQVRILHNSNSITFQVSHTYSRSISDYTC